MVAESGRMQSLLIKRGRGLPLVGSNPTRAAEPEKKKER